MSDQTHVARDDDETPPPGGDAAAGPGRGRLVVARVLLVTGTVVAILAILSVWISRQALETDQWTETSSTLLEEPPVQQAVAGYLVDRLYANVDVAEQLRAALPPRADAL